MRSGFPATPSCRGCPTSARSTAGITPGRHDGVYRRRRLPIAPLICWESAFADLAYAQLQHKAQILVVSTDDAWFGKTSGPYMHAQIAQFRAIESGAYVVRAAATGISGIIAPDGRWQARSRLEERTARYRAASARALPTVFRASVRRRSRLALIALYASLAWSRSRGGAEAANDLKERCGNESGSEAALSF